MTGADLQCITYEDLVGTLKLQDWEARRLLAEVANMDGMAQREDSAFAAAGGATATYTQPPPDPSTAYGTPPPQLPPPSREVSFPAAQRGQALYGAKAQRAVPNFSERLADMNPNYMNPTLLAGGGVMPNGAGVGSLLGGGGGGGQVPYAALPDAGQGFEVEVQPDGQVEVEVPQMDVPQMDVPQIDMPQVEMLQVQALPAAVPVDQGNQDCDCGDCNDVDCDDCTIQ